MTDAGEPLRSRHPRSFWVGMVGLAALVFMGIAAVLEMAPTREQCRKSVEQPGKGDLGGRRAKAVVPRHLNR